MTTSWGERYVDQQVERAWLDLRLDLAERFETALETDEMAPLDITTATGETLTVELAGDEPGCLVVMAGDEVDAYANVDEAAYAVVKILRDEWQVVHPVFLDSEAVEVPAIVDQPVTPALPALARAASREQLHEWVVATFTEDLGKPVKIGPDGAIFWRTRRGRRVAVVVHNAGRIELTAPVARRVSFKKAHRLIDRLSRQYFALKFFLLQDTFMVSQPVIAAPYSPDQLRQALAAFMSSVDTFDWVQEHVESKRAAADRTRLTSLEKERDEARAAVESLRAELAAKQDELDHTDSEFHAACGEIDRIVGLLERALGRNHLRSCEPRDDVA